MLSIILSIAICATAVLGCLITVNAAEGPSYVITGAQCKKNDTAATATVEFTVPGGMAAGAFTLGASIELSADAPLREPYAAWLQGGLNFASGQAGVLLGAQSMVDKGIIKL